MWCIESVQCADCDFRVLRVWTTVLTLLEPWIQWKETVYIWCCWVQPWASSSNLQYSKFERCTNEHLATYFGGYMYLTSLHALIALGQIASKKDGI